MLTPPLAGASFLGFLGGAEACQKSPMISRRKVDIIRRYQTERPILRGGLEYLRPRFPRRVNSTPPRAPAPPDAGHFFLRPILGGAGNAGLGYRPGGRKAAAVNHSGFSGTDIRGPYQTASRGGRRGRPAADFSLPSSPLPTQHRADWRRQSAPGGEAGVLGRVFEAKKGRIPVAFSRGS